MTGVVYDKDTYDIIHDTLSAGIIKVTKILKASLILEVVAKDTPGGNILDRSICLIDKDISTELLSMGVSTMNTYNTESTDVTSITTASNGKIMKCDLYKPNHTS